MLESIPQGLCKLKSLRELRLINNHISEIPNELFKNLVDLRVLILNANPIENLSGEVRNLTKLQILGIASTLIKELPQEISKLKLKQILVHDTNLVSPKLAIAIRGFKAIKEYFDHLQAVACNQATADDDQLDVKLDSARDRKEEEQAGKQVSLSRAFTLTTTVGMGLS